ncbi:hypothetical protein [Variovorax sp. DXTD-1]|uniref:hypothetical protein n=1 Tax=Variovorax sp. DXTD-1 TaxID=2495592 RepID=UPI000F866771|nr:hypothetical protein [Variovorax sp. DXTD-1]RST48584.1 hypothetical protein EJI00_17100 [Variovorax sp. DXTD-1]
MSIEFLRVLAKHPAPATLTDPHDVDNLLVLRAAGLVAALTFKPDAGGREVGRFLALTPDGRSALGMATDGSNRGAQAISQLQKLPQ